MKDPYIDPATGIFRNKLGITDAAELARAEFEFSKVRALELLSDPIKGDFDRTHLEKVHERLFGDVYDWAGKERLYGVEKDEPVLGLDAEGKPRSVEYPPPNVPFGLGEQLAYSFAQLKRDDHLKGLEDDPERFASKFARHMTEIWECHEFREGNTRTTTAFCRQLAAEAGYALADNFPPDPSIFRDSLALAAANGDYELLQAQVDAGLDLARSPRRELEPDPTSGEILDAELRLELETERRLETLSRVHRIDMRALEGARDEAKQAHEAHLEAMTSSPPARKGARERAELEGRELNRRRLDTDVAFLNRRDDFGHDRRTRETDVRQEIEKDLPDDAALVKRGIEKRSFDKAIERWRTAVKGHEAAPQDRAAANELVDSSNRLQGVASCRARLSTVQSAKMERQREPIERARDRGRGMER